MAGVDGPGAAARRRAVDQLRGEWRRLLTRRLVQRMLAGTFLAYAAMAVSVGMLHFGPVTPEVVAQAREEVIAAAQANHERCLVASVPTGMTRDQLCPPVPSAETLAIQDLPIPVVPFTMAEHLRPGLVGVLVSLALVMFVVGASSIGAEWTHRTLAVQLTRHPRRVLLTAVKVVVLAGLTAVVTVGAVGVWFVLAWLLQRTRGEAAPFEPGFWADVAALAGRGASLVLLASLFGFALAHLLRGSAAALGVLLGYLVVVETAVRLGNDENRRWLLLTHAAAVLRGGTSFWVDRPWVDSTGEVLPGFDVVVTAAQGAALLTVAVAVLLVASTAAFRLRDVV